MSLRQRNLGRTLLAVALLLGGCQTLGRHKAAPAPPPEPEAPTPAPAPPPRKPLIIFRPAPAPRNCVPRSLAPPPRYPDTDAALRNAAGAADRYQLMAAGRILREKRLQELERVIAGCRTP